MINPFARAGVDGRVPVEAKLRLPFPGEGIDLARLAGGATNADDAAALRLEVDDVGVVGVGDDSESVAAAEIAPVPVGDATGRDRRRGPRAVVLQAAVDVVRPL